MELSVLRLAVILVMHFAIGSYGAVNLIYERSTRSNEITLICRSSVNFQPLSNADFWLNTTAMPLTSLLSSSSYTVTDVGRFQFTITQDLEGEFYCGHIGISTSNTEVLISYPHPDANTPTYHAIQVGDSVVIPCAIKPGALKQHYTVQWMNGEEPLTSSGGQPSNRYRLTDDFSVTINSVETNDDGDRYHCVVAIDNPQVSGTADYYVTGPQTTLHVYDIPHITSLPEDRVLLDSEATDVTFTCSAKGVPTVTITWLYNGQDVREREDSGRFQVELIPSATDRTITSWLVIKQIKVVDSGTYVCWAHNTVDTGEEDVQFSDTESATLSILTNNIVFDTGITTEGDLLLQLLLPAPIEEPLSLVLRFTSVTTGATREVEIEDNFMNTDTISHQVENAMLPFTEFSVQVAMKIRGVRGMFTPASQELNTGVPVTLPPETAPQSQSECAVSETTIIIASAAIGGGLVAIALLVISATVFCKIFNFFTHEAQIDQLLRQVERYKDDPETKARFLDILVKRMDRDSDERESQGSRENSEPPRGPVTIQNHNSVPHSNRNVVISIDFPNSEETDGGYVSPPPYPDLTPDDKCSMAETRFDISSGVNIPAQPEGEHNHDRTNEAAEPYLETAEKND